MIQVEFRHLVLCIPKMAQAIREPLPLLSRYLASPSRQSNPRILAPNSPTKRPYTTAPEARGSKLIAALDALNGNPVIEVKGLDEDVEIARTGHVTESSGGDGKASKRKPVMAKESTIKQYGLHTIAFLLCRELTGMESTVYTPSFILR